VTAACQDYLPLGGTAMADGPDETLAVVGHRIRWDIDPTDVTEKPLAGLQMGLTASVDLRKLESGCHEMNLAH
jgi:hypothetical protein